MRILNFSVLVLLHSVCVRIASAIEARPVPFYEIQPNGERIVLKVHGDQYGSYMTDLEGKIQLNEQPIAFFGLEIL